MFGSMAKHPVDINLALDYDPDEKLLQYMNRQRSIRQGKGRKDIVEGEYKIEYPRRPTKTEETEICFKVGSTVLKGISQGKSILWGS